MFKKEINFSQNTSFILD